MKIVAYVTHDQVPRARIWLAQIVRDDGEVHPVYFPGATEREVRATAEKWWAEQLAAEQKRREPKRRRGAGRSIEQPEALSEEAI